MSEDLESQLEESLKSIINKERTIDILLLEKFNELVKKAKAKGMNVHVYEFILSEYELMEVDYKVFGTSMEEDYY